MSHHTTVSVKQPSALLAAGAKPNESACMRIAEAAAVSAIATHVRIIDKIRLLDYNIIGASATVVDADFECDQTFGSVAF